MLRALVFFGLLWAMPVWGLELGEKAPALGVVEWLQGSPVKVDDAKGTIYVVEFWATWCGPCRESMPHLNELQKKFAKKNVVIVGLSDEDPEVISAFLAKNKGKVDYRIASYSEAKMTPYLSTKNFRGIPFSFLIDGKGQVAWFGHPLVGLDEVLGQVVAGTYDIEATRKAREAATLMSSYFSLVQQGNSYRAEEVGKKILKDAAGEPMLLNELAWTILTEKSLVSRDLSLAMSAATLACEKTSWKNSAILDTYARALFESGKLLDAVKWQKTAIAVCTDASLKKELEKTLAFYQEKLTKTD